MRAPFAALLVLALAGCASASRRDADWTPTQPLAAATPAPAPTAGAIYGGQGGLRLFQDKRAREAGDLVTVVLVERTVAQSRASTQISKDSETSIAAPSLFGAPVTYGGRNILDAEVSGSRTFKGDGDTSQSNRLDGEITATVVQRLPNGNLVIVGEKRVRLNQGDELIRIQGVVRPADIGPDNRIASSRVADARIVYGGRGPVSKSNAMGWLSRFFNSVLMPL
ncbi:flagellar basal body L-ring protein FlgH [Vulcaniibacterium thermophilum]|jgi:flagellar L-ring protein precursor FlgH|uniref:Flagellar L-ring protein n=1 Tax=Vulcaniibacterium thermophilum TaxID=1169913 RepID=A0A918Z4D4_9GAMM|nr:flagellar basal body L-ring protein FlgH [Vulcaniibacterium thermophilum]GHE37317.1 flagellar L-ring protein [Vulcaniibacterium thermophilum]